MTKAEFDAAVDHLLVRFGGSLTSGRRTRVHSKKVGGFDGDPHTWGLGADVVWDTSDPDPHYIDYQAEQLGLKLIHEYDHDHLQPLDFPPGVVTSYGGVIKT